MPIEIKFEQRLQHFMARAGLSQTDLARLVGVFPSAVTMWCGGATKPTHANLEKIRKALGVGLDEFFGPLEEISTEAQE